jgi:hypothetical protein
VRFTRLDIVRVVVRWDVYTDNPEKGFMLGVEDLGKVFTSFSVPALCTGSSSVMCHAGGWSRAVGSSFICVNDMFGLLSVSVDINVIRGTRESDECAGTETAFTGHFYMPTSARSSGR